MARTQEVRVRVGGEGRGQSWCEDSQLYESQSGYENPPESG